MKKGSKALAGLGFERGGGGGFESNQQRLLMSSSGGSAGNSQPVARRRDKQEGRGGHSRASRQQQQQQIINGNHLLNFKANFQFLLLPGTSLEHRSFTNADVVVDWESVESVCLIQGEGGEGSGGGGGEGEAGWRCPICLEHPRCPRITRCGHGPFCAVCILRHLGGEPYRRCPMCFDNVSCDRLAGALLRAHKPPVAGQSASFVLLLRDKEELIPRGVDRWGGGSCTAWCPKEGQPAATFSRLVLAKPQQLLQRMATEDAELAAFREESLAGGDTEWLPYISQARALLVERRAQLSAKGALALSPTASPRANSAPRSAFFTKDGGNHGAERRSSRSPARRGGKGRSGGGGDGTQLGGSAAARWGDGGAPATPAAAAAGAASASAAALEGEHEGGGAAASVAEGSDGGGAAAASGDAADVVEREGGGEEDGSSAAAAAGAGDAEEYGSGAVAAAAAPGDAGGTRGEALHPPARFAFYQLEDGQYAFMHPLSMRCLLEEHGLGGGCALPTALNANILEVETFRLSQDLRRRYAFLGHLPEHCSVMFVELDLANQLSDQREDAMLALRLATIDLDGPPPGASTAPLSPPPDGGDAGSPGSGGGDAAAAAAADSPSTSPPPPPPAPALFNGSTASFARVVGRAPNAVDDFPALGAAAAAAAAAAVASAPARPASGAASPILAGAWGKQRLAPSPLLGGAGGGDAEGPAELALGTPATSGKKRGGKGKGGGKGQALFSNAGQRGGVGR
ncbi:hypothetical protein JKP88DRAFT_350636 [Tribonema minus]|uniref:RING-type domain-containing protein n=1 Tax=Tribonema minus TaxID=303371 RepID=A0A835YQ46_9STRA|nr:hypothetical protein JKP88DRAFT_350636 [Tribonema minus]